MECIRLLLLESCWRLSLHLVNIVAGNKMPSFPPCTKINLAIINYNDFAVNNDAQKKLLLQLGNNAIEFLPNLPESSIDRVFWLPAVTFKGGWIKF